MAQRLIMKVPRPSDRLKEPCPCPHHLRSLVSLHSWPRPRKPTSLLVGVCWARWRRCLIPASLGVCGIRSQPAPQTTTDQLKQDNAGAAEGEEALSLMPMNELDPDDPRPPYLQVANALRAAILTRTFKPGDKLPSGPELSRRYNVARMTVQQAVRVLRDEGLVVSRQGSGVYVRERTERAVGLRPHIERAFERPEVSIDFAGFSGETLHGAIQEPLDKIRIGRLTPQALKIRVLVPDLTVPIALLSLADGGRDDAGVRGRSEQIMRQANQAIVDAVVELEQLGLVKQASAEIRTYRNSPVFKLYIINNNEAFFGFYPVPEHTISVNGQPTSIYDAMEDKDAILFHFVASDDNTSVGPRYVQQAQLWFNSMWAAIGREFTL
jgi:DNA-binding transcriptional regulator YhcF (GntR family)